VTVNTLKIARFQLHDKEFYGIMEPKYLICLPALADRLGENLPSHIEEFIAQEDAQETAEALLAKANPNDIQDASVPLSKISLLAPIASPPKILCLGWNYIDHAAETKITPPEEPVVFMKPHTAVIGPNEEIIKRPFVKELDYEGELAVVIGKRAKDVPVTEAFSCVFGYTIFNDVSARDFQFKDKQWTRGKGFDTFAPTGPCITTKDELPDSSNLGIRTWVNSELRQNGTTRDMVFSVAQIIYHLSRVMTLEPCDIIATGTPSGVGMAMKPPKWLTAGDVVRIEIEGIGTLENPISEK
jgi:2-keto-4-pentenoate hydratase/2-oxohepta-3-ene-1,7-dioic acid hydratase in catechol pathway